MQYPGSLHNHTDYSNLRLRDSINRIDEMIDYAIELGHDVIAFTEHESISNAVKIEDYYTKIKEKHPNFKVIRGNEIYLCRDGLNKDSFLRGEDKYYHFILLAKDAEGHKQIRELSTKAWLRSYMQGGLRRVPTYYSDLKEIVGKNKGHVIFSQACLGGFVQTKLLEYKKQGEPQEYYDKIIKWILDIQDICGKENYFLEMQPSKNNEQIYVNQKMLEISKELNIPYIITCDAHYLKKDDAFIHKAYLNSQDGEREVDAFYATTYLMGDSEIRSFFEYFTKEELEEGYKNIQKIKDMCEDYTLKRPLKIPRLKWKEPKVKEITPDWFDKIPYLKIFNESDYEGDKVLARAVISKILDEPDLQNQEVYDELNGNLESTWISSEVNNTHWSAYFLNLQNIIDVMWDAGTLVGNARGSGGGFLLLYVLDIIQLNKMKENTKLYPWRFLNPNRVSILDIDSDIEGSKRKKVLEALREYYGRDKVSNVVTFGTEGSRQSLATAIRGLGLDSDLSMYLSSLIPADRGITRTLHQCYYGDEKNGLNPIYEFRNAMDEYSDVWKVAQKIEGLVCRVGQHAGGVIFVDEPFTESTALMRVPNGDIVTQYDLLDAEECSLIKIDCLSVEYLDKIHTCLDLLIEYGYIKPESTLRKTYEKYLGIYTLERDNLDMWKMVWNHEIQSLFQMEKQSGIQGIALTHPKSVDDLAVLNSVIRLQAEEKGAEQPLEKYTRFKNDISLWYQEMNRWGLTKEEQQLLETIVGSSYGIAESQEKIMTLVQLPECGGWDLTWADRLRKAVARKSPKQYKELEKEFFDNAEKNSLSINLCKYVWNVLVAMSRGYSFNSAHTLSYSIAALQEMNLAYKYPIIFWDCACLITDSGGVEDEDKETNAVNYEKIAVAIGKMKKAGIEIIPPDINQSKYTFSPDVENNRIIFGLAGISNVGEEVIQEIIKKRPYESIEDFYNKTHLRKQANLSLIKAGAFDQLEENRKYVMAWYLWETCDKKSRVTLQNMAMLSKFKLLPENKEKFSIYEFNRYLKAICKYNKEKYKLDERAMNFLTDKENINIEIDEMGNYLLDIKKWERFYDSEMDFYRNWMKENKESILQKLNDTIFLEDWNKYALGNYSHWEMESLCYYYHEHELTNVNSFRYGIVDFEKLPEQPIPVKSFKKGDHTIDMYNLVKIAGTCIAKNKDKGIVTILTTTGVVNVRLRKEQFAFYDRQISEINEKGEKKVIEKSWFTRGNLIMVQGIRRNNEFVAKKYKSTPGHTIYKIDSIHDDGTLTLVYERAHENV